MKGRACLLWLNHLKHMVIISTFSLMLKPLFFPTVVKVNGKFHLRAGLELAEGESRHSSTLTLTSVLDGVGCQRHVPAAFSPGKASYQLYRRLGGPQGWSERVLKMPPPPQGLDPRTVQRVSSHYTDWAIPAHVSHRVKVCVTYNY
jgi:hypothetical protein